MTFDLASCRRLLELSEAEIRERLGVREDDVSYDDGYEGLEHVAEIYRPDAFPGRIFLRDGRPELIYLPGGPELDQWSVSDLERQLPGEGEYLRSRAGKTFNHIVHAGEGVAYSADGDELAFVEVFRPRSLEAYEAEIYEDPGPFIR